MVGNPEVDAPASRPAVRGALLSIDWSQNGHGLNWRQWQHLPAGSVFHEPADQVILRFDNASAEKPMRFIRFYLLEGRQELIEMLPGSSGVTLAATWTKSRIAP
jgi:hypothetical protein